MQDLTEPPTLTFLMPCLNEERTLKACIEEIKATAATINVSFEIVIADNNSTDRSAEIAIDEGARVIPVPEKGYGAALIGGINASKGKYLIMADADLSYDFAASKGILEKLQAGAHLVMGNRFLGRIDDGAMPFLHRYLGNPVLSWIGKLLFKIPCGDFHCGIRGFNRDAILNLKLATTGMEFASEMVVKAALAKLTIQETPAYLRKDGRDRPPHLRTWRDGWRHLRFLLLYSPKWLFTIPGLTLMAFGVILMLAVIDKPLTLGHVRLDVSTLVYSAIFQITGLQIASIGIFAQTYAESHNLLPARKSNERRKRSLESGVIAGTLLLVAGIALAIASVFQWSNTGFGDLNPSQTLRIVVPAALSMAYGVQIVFLSFASGVLELKKQ